MNNEPHIGIDIYQRKGGQTFSDNKQEACDIYAAQLLL